MTFGNGHKIKQRGRWLRATSMLLILKHKMDDDAIEDFSVPFRMQKYNHS
jgi:hypothetical protein